MTTLRVDVWSDIACPWCFVGKRRLEAAIKTLSDEITVQVVWHSFELDTSAPAVLDTTKSYAERIAQKYRRTVAQGQSMIDQMTATAAVDGIAMRFDQIRPGNTFDAHRLLHLAAARGLQDQLKERLFAAYLSQGEAIGDHKALQRIAPEVGLDSAEVATLLASDQHAKDVRQDQTMARELGISGVPFFVIGGRIAVSGAQAADALADAMKQAVALLASEGVATTTASGVQCDIHGCD
jgi:predicted DsbA family dithiol-disulfide isomerase